MDLLQREGMYPVPPQAPVTMGVELSGTIEKFGDDLEGDFKIGDGVFGLAYGGMFSSPSSCFLFSLLFACSFSSLFIWHWDAKMPE